MEKNLQEETPRLRKKSKLKINRKKISRTTRLLISIITRKKSKNKIFSVITKDSPQSLQILT
jgi:nicotinic acid mononucleotide adenylyltransferase